MLAFLNIGRKIFECMLGDDNFGSDEARPWLRGLMGFVWVLGITIILLSPLPHLLLG